MKKPSEKIWAELVEKKGGNITEIARSMGTTRQTIYNWMESDPEFKEIYDNIEESHLDLAESQLHLMIKGLPKFETDEDGNKRFAGWIERPSESAIFFKLKTKGKKRGYIERSEIDHSNKDGTLRNIQVTITKDGAD
jgi:predicted transcriptional regulator